MDIQTVMAKLQAYEAASTTFNSWVNGMQALSLLRGVIASGIFDAVRTPRTAAEIAAITGIDAERAADICTALQAQGIVQREGARYQLTPDVATLSDPDNLQTLDAYIDVRMVEARTLETIAAPERPYTSLPAEDLLAVAEGVTFRSTSPVLQGLWPVWAQDAIPEFHALQQTGCHHAEFGCGVGGGLLGMALIYPEMTAVGFELNAAVIAETRRRAAAFGVADRVELRHADVRDITDEAVFDTGFWSDGFFPTPSRAAALAAIFRAMKPGGYLFVPACESGVAPATEEALYEPQGRFYSTNKLVYRRWDVPTPNGEELRAELEAAGFEHVRVVTFGIFEFVLVRRPVA